MFEEFEANCKKGAAKFIITFIGNHFQLEAGSYYNKTIVSGSLKEALTSILPKEACKFNKNGELSCNVALIPKQIESVKQKPKELSFEKVESEEEEEVVPSKKQNHSLLILLERKGLKVAAVNYEDVAISEKLL